MAMHRTLAALADTEAQGWAEGARLYFRPLNLAKEALRFDEPNPQSSRHVKETRGGEGVSPVCRPFQISTIATSCAQRLNLSPLQALPQPSSHYRFRHCKRRQAP